MNSRNCDILFRILKAEKEGDKKRVRELLEEVREIVKKAECEFEKSMATRILERYQNGECA